MIQRLLGALDRVAETMAYAAGGVLLLASFFITADVIGRKFVGLSSGLTDEFGGYALALGGLWALAFGLSTGGHVRIDILLPRFPRPLQAVLDYAALFLMGAFASILAFYAWKLTLESFATDARAMSFLRTPLGVPQAGMALGFTLLALQAAAMLAVVMARCVRGRALAPVPVRRVADLTEGL